MRWRKGRRSRNIEDRRGTGVRLGGGGRLRRGGIGGGLGLVAVVVLALVFGVDPLVLLQGMSGGGGPVVQTAPAPAPGLEDETTDFVSVVLADTEDTWQALFQSMGGQYEDPKLVLFTGAVNSACGFAQAAVGPFYCPGDRKLYLDLSFFDALRTRFGAPGDFAQAYVIAHEVGHHVQTLLGIERQVRGLQRNLSRKEANALSVLMELQADCFAGVWAHHADRSRQLLEAGDVEEGLNAASAIGDDRIQRQTTGQVTPDSFTHGSSAQRVTWFKHGLTEGAPRACDTFNAAGADRF